jgi:acyl carrier protein
MKASPYLEPVMIAFCELFSLELAAADVDRPLTKIPGFNYDSLRAFEFVSRLEERFSIEIDLVNDDLEYSLSTLRRASELVWRHVQSRLDQPASQDAWEAVR